MRVSRYRNKELGSLHREEAVTDSAVLALAFRPFFLFGTLYGVLAIFLWAAYQASLVALPSYFEGTLWHAHEMLFGFVVSILAGFLLTASKNWAKTRGVHGRTLLALFLVWLAGRLAILSSDLLPPWLVAASDLAFLPFLSLLVWRTLSRGAARTNFVFVFWLAVLSVANALMHAEALGLTSQTARTGYLLGVDTMVVVMVLIGGRVIPMFTQNTVAGLSIVKRPWLEKVALLTVVTYLISDIVEETSFLTGAAAILAGTASLFRLSGWKPFSTFRNPILWILHLGYAFLSLGLLWRGLSLTLLPMKSSIPLHLLTAGAMGMLILGMTSRVSLGHTGRPLIVAKPVVLAYGLVLLGALTRVLVPLFLPSAYIAGMVGAALIWGTALLLFAIVYWPILTQPRIDGLEG